MKSAQELERLAATLGGIPVWGCLPGSPAARAGVRYGDIVLKVNGAATPTIEAYTKARSAAKTVLTIVVFRDGEEVTIKMRLPRARTRASVADAARQVVDGRMMPVARKKKPPTPAS